jgi:hypothetical protein
VFELTTGSHYRRLAVAHHGCAKQWHEHLHQLLAECPTSVEKLREIFDELARERVRDNGRRSNANDGLRSSTAHFRERGFLEKNDLARR